MAVELIALEATIVDRFFALHTPQDVAKLLELSSYDFLEYYLFILPESQRYTRFVIPKKRGGDRIILEPAPNLKIIQKKLLQVLQLKLVYEPKPAVQGFTKSRSIVKNAAQHIKRKFVLNLDLKDFFPSIHFGRVRGMFMAYPYNFNDKVATVLAQICSLSSGLPQGAPTSPIIANMICAKMDSQLQKLAKENGCFY
ncbi:MAG: reverse transcriptase family protein, partial [Chloroflexi bacterium]|nr:reverse transcriptase family protein [Chloroflexota bacterium]